MKIYIKKVNAQRQSERRTAKTNLLHKIEAVEGGYRVVQVEPAPPPIPQAPAKAKPAPVAAAKAPPTPRPEALPVAPNAPRSLDKAPADEGRPVKAGTKNATMVAGLLAGETLDQMAARPNSYPRDAIQARLHGLRDSTGIGYKVSAGTPAERTYTIDLPANLTAETVIKAAIRRHGAAVESAARGELPAPPDFTADTHKRYRAKLGALVAMAEAGDDEGMLAVEIKPISSSRNAMIRYRDLAVTAIRAGRQTS